MKKIFVLLLPVVLIYGISTLSATAQQSTASEPSTARFQGWEPGKSSSSDVTLTANIQQVVTTEASGTRGGLHVILGTPQGTVESLMGPYLSQEAKQELAPGNQIQVTGRIEAINGKNYLLAKQLFIDGQQIKVRNDNGSLIRKRAHARTYSQSSQNGAL